MAEASLENDPKCRVAIVSFPWQAKAPYKFLSELLKILDPLCKKIVVIDGYTDRINVVSESVELRDLGVGVHYVAEKKPTFYSGLLWIFECILAQLKSSVELIKIRREVDIVVFYLANPFYLIPVITSKLLGKRTIDIITRSTSNNLLTRIYSLQDPLLFKLFDGISPETSALIEELNLAKYQSKLLPEGARFVDTSFYKTYKSIKERELVIGFIGRLVKTKGVAEFIEAIPLVSKSHNNVQFLIVGSGDLSHFVEKKRKDLLEKYGVGLEVTGWIAEEELPSYLNALRLLVLPTYHPEGLSTIVLEAMACGTPVLTKAKGGVVDVIRDEETGFIMEDHTPAVIAENITRAISHPDIDRIVANAHNVIERKFTYIKAVERWRRILELAVS
ncbi:MAG: glycosyltransferase family 4 protein [Halobacteriota archaeon]